jgi:hypothetical protein
MKVATALKLRGDFTDWGFISNSLWDKKVGCELPVKTGADLTVRVSIEVVRVFMEISPSVFAVECCIAYLLLL